MIKAEPAKPEPPMDEPLLDTGIKGDGPDSLGLSGKPGNGRIGGTAGNRSRRGFDASRLQGWVVEAKQRNRKTRGEAEPGRQSLARRQQAYLARTVGGYTDDPSLDRAILGEVLNGLRLQLPPLGC